MNTPPIELCDDTNATSSRHSSSSESTNSTRRRPATSTESSWAVGCGASRAKSSQRSTATRGGVAVWLLTYGCTSRSAAAVSAERWCGPREAEARRRGCEQVILSTHTFQAPAFYERLGYEKLAVIRGRPKGHADVIFAKCLKGPNGA